MRTPNSFVSDNQFYLSQSSKANNNTKEYLGQDLTHMTGYIEEKVT